MQGVLSVVGLNFIDYVAAPNQAFFVVRLKPYDQRTSPSESVDAIIARLRPQLAAIPGAIVFPFNLPPIFGLGNAGGFQYVAKALQGQSPTDLARVVRALQVSANEQPELSGVFSTFAAETPQVYLEIDRDKAQVLGVKVSDIFNALQSTLGGYYVNDFNLFGRTWQVNVQSDSRFRDAIEDIYRVYVRTSSGAMVPIRALAQARPVQGPQAVIRYNGSRAAVINGAPKPGYSSGQAIAAMERLSASTLPAGYGYEWTGTALQEKIAGGKAGDRAGAGGVVRLPLPRGALRELEHSAAGPALRRRRPAGSDRGHPGVAPGLRRLCANRARRAGGACRQEQHPDRRIRGAAAACRKVDRRRGASRERACASAR